MDSRTDSQCLVRQPAHRVIRAQYRVSFVSLLSRPRDYTVARGDRAPPAITPR